MKQSPGTLTERLKADLPLTLEPPVIRKTNYISSGFVLNCGFARTNGGRFWASFGAREDGPRSSLVIAYSDDEGGTWNDQVFELDGGDTPNGFHLTNRVGALWNDPVGRLHLFFIQTLDYFDGRSGTWESHCDNPDDPDPEWSEPVRLWHATPLNKPCVCRNGDWLLPVSLSIRRHMRFGGEQPEASLFAELDPIRGANVIASRNHGRSWEWRGFQRSTDPLFDEHHILERQDGTLRMYARDSFGIVSADSNDNGYHWTPFKREFFTTSARFSVTKLPSGNWLMVRYDCPDKDVRKNLTAYISTDEGRNWSGGLLLDDREKISYPDAFVHPDGRIFVQYDHLRQTGSLVMAVFREEDALAGKNVSGQVRLKQETLR